MVSRDPSYSELSDEQLKDRINAMLELRVKQCETVDPETAAYYSSISFKVRKSLADTVFESIRGLGILGKIISDKSITEVMINGYDCIFVEKAGDSIVKPEIKNKVEIPEMLPHKCATEVLAETEKFVEPIDNYSAGKRILAGEQEGAQIVYFKLAKAEIDSNYLDNERVLEHIIDVIRRISEDPEVEIARVVLLGLSSPEGAFEFNKQLSGKRAEALKQYIADRIALADSCFALVNGDEGWEELRYKVEHSDMEYRKEVLNIIDSVPIMKGREGQLQRLKRGVPYRYLEEHFFPQLRRAGYIKVYYRMKNGTI